MRVVGVCQASTAAAGNEHVAAEADAADTMGTAATPEPALAATAAAGDDDVGTEEGQDPDVDGNAGDGTAENDADEPMVNDPALLL